MKEYYINLVFKKSIRDDLLIESRKNDYYTIKKIEICKHTIRITCDSKNKYLNKLIKDFKEIFKNENTLMLATIEVINE